MTDSIVWDGSDKAKRWLKNNLRVSRYDMWADGDLTIYLWIGVKKVNHGDTIIIDKDGEPHVVERQN